MAILLAIFFISIATATFVENDFGQSVAKKFFYNAKWFELVLFFGILNLIGVTLKNKLYRKPVIFLFHMSFILILLGAGITRYLGFEGTMPIREGSASNTIITEKRYLTIKAQCDNASDEINKPVLFSFPGRNVFNKNLQLKNKKLEVTLKDYIPSADLTIEPAEEGSPLAEIVFQGWNKVILRQGESAQVGNLNVSFDSSEKSDLFLTFKDGMLFFKAPFPVLVTSMSDQTVSTLEADSLHRFNPMMLHNFDNHLAVLRKFLPEARIKAIPSENENENNPEALLFTLKSSAETKNLYVSRNNDGSGTPQTVQLNGITVSVSYGSKKVLLPFQIYLNDFIFERYPGSNSPAWYESRVTVNDNINNRSFTKRIYMNHVLKYQGYRFYQASYDEDEKGTILSVNHDWAGTLVTYSGYLIMSISMLLALFQKKSRFRFLFDESVKIQNAKKSLVIILLMISTSFLHLSAAEKSVPVVDKEHANAFGELLVQSVDGRIEPINTLSSELLRKISRRTSYKGLTSDQVLLSIMIDPQAWQSQPIVKIGHERIGEIIGENRKYVPFISFFSKTDGSYLLANYANQANQRKPAYRGKFDNEVIRADERVNVLYLTITGAFLKIFPLKDDANNKWYSPVDAHGKFLTEDSIFTNNILPLYLETVKQAVGTNDWTEADKLLGAMKSFQKKYAGNLYPSDFKTKLEIFYNKADIFPRLSSIYGIVGFLLLLIQFAGIFQAKLKLKVPVMIAMVIILVTFSAHTLALIIRWYVSGHAPWSNGYEALTYIAWAAVLVGIIFSSKSSITLSATSILAFLILNTAHLSWMDPEITNLVPVLKSYWLIIHVAVITSSYGFLGLGALLAAINIVIMFFENSGRKDYIDLAIKEITNIIEMTLIAGLYLLTIGTFLGGVWANESWGRYWGWDPKETWALATVIVYAFIVHMRMVNGLKSQFGFNLASLLGFGSVIMTYFGVNYYLSGLHSYAKGDPLPVPVFVYYTILVIAIVSALAFINQRRLNKSNVQKLSDM